MKKFRYTDPSSVTFFQRIRPFIVVFASWNIIGICIWKFASKRAADKDPAWATRSQGEKIAIISGSVPQNIKKYKYTLFGPEKKENSDEKS